MGTKMHERSNTSIFQNKTAVPDKFRVFGAFLSICSKLEDDRAFLTRPIKKILFD